MQKMNLIPVSVVVLFMLSAFPISVSAAGPGPQYIYVGKTFDFDEKNWYGTATVEGAVNDDGLVILNLYYYPSDPIVNRFKVLKEMSAPWFEFDGVREEFNEDDLYTGEDYQAGIYYYDGGSYFELHSRYNEYISAAEDWVDTSFWIQFWSNGDISYQIHSIGIDQNEWIRLVTFTDWSMKYEGNDSYYKYDLNWQKKTQESIIDNYYPFDPDQNHKPIYTQGAKIKVSDVYIQYPIPYYQINAYSSAQVVESPGGSDFYGLLDDNSGGSGEETKESNPIDLLGDDNINHEDIVTFYYQDNLGEQHNDYIISTHATKVTSSWIYY